MSAVKRETVAKLQLRSIDALTVEKWAPRRLDNRAITNGVHHDVFLLARVLGLSRQAYYAWTKRGPCARAVQDQVPTERILGPPDFPPDRPCTALHGHGGRVNSETPYSEHCSSVSELQLRVQRRWKERGHADDPHRR